MYTCVLLHKYAVPHCGLVNGLCIIRQCNVVLKQPGPRVLLGVHRRQHYSRASSHGRSLTHPNIYPLTFFTVSAHMPSPAVMALCVFVLGIVPDSAVKGSQFLFFPLSFERSFFFYFLIHSRHCTPRLPLLKDGGRKNLATLAAQVSPLGLCECGSHPSTGPLSFK